MIYHEIKVKYDRQTGEDNPGKVKETYLIDGAVSFADAENCLMEEIKPFIFGDCEVQNCKRSQFFETFANPDGAFWYKARVEMITIDGEKETGLCQVLPEPCAPRGHVEDITLIPMGAARLRISAFPPCEGKGSGQKGRRK